MGIRLFEIKSARGIAMLQTGAERSEYNRFTAMSGLISVLLDAKDYDAVIKWSRLGLASYPNNRTLFMGTCYSVGSRETFTGSGKCIPNIAAQFTGFPRTTSV